MPEARSETRAAEPLLALLKRRIAERGPITVSDYMQACLGDPEHGYYATRDPFGAGGDFVTAPEVSQMFGELIGLWCAVAWRQMGAPTPVRLIELGPGRGTLMADMLRAARVVPEFLEAARVDLVETSRRLRQMQQDRLAASGANLHWHADLGDVPAGASIAVANEFLDALPVRQFERREGHWYERCVGLSSNGALEFCLSSEPLAALDILPEQVRDAAEDGDMAEIRPGADALVDVIARRARTAPALALFIDYGHAASAPGETLQAVKAHDTANPLSRPGEADLTAHVDFAQLGAAASARGLSVHGPISQGSFLTALGLRERCARLAESAGAAERDTVVSGARRLADPAAMGELFKVMALASEGLTPAPFAGAAAREETA